MSAFWAQCEQVETDCHQASIFPADAPLESVCINMLGYFMKLSRGNEYLLVIFDRFTCNFIEVSVRRRSRQWFRQLMGFQLLTTKGLHRRQRQILHLEVLPERLLYDGH